MQQEMVVYFTYSYYLQKMVEASWSVLVILETIWFVMKHLLYLMILSAPPIVNSSLSHKTELL